MMIFERQTWKTTTKITAACYQITIASKNETKYIAKQVKYVENVSFQESIQNKNCHQINENQKKKFQSKISHSIIHSNDILTWLFL